MLKQRLEEKELKYRKKKSLKNQCKVFLWKWNTLIKKKTVRKL